MHDIHFKPATQNELAAIESLVTINERSQGYKSGVYEVTFSFIKLAKNRDGKYIATIAFKRLDNNNTISIYRNFIEDQPYGKLELSYDIVHDLFSLLGVKNTRDTIKSKDFNMNDLQQKLEKRLGTELIIAIYNEYRMKNDLVNIHTKLRLATTIDGYSQDELNYNDKTNSELLWIADRLCPVSTQKYLEKHNDEYVREDKDISLINRRFKKIKE